MSWRRWSKGRSPPLATSSLDLTPSWLWPVIPTAALPAVLWGAVLLTVIVVTVLAYRRWDQTLTIYVLSTPLLVAVAVLSFENVARLLPPTF